MPIINQKAIIALLAVVDIATAVRTAGRAIRAKEIAARHGLPARYLEPVLQGLVRDGLLKSVRGAQGGYELARDPRKLSVNDILLSVTDVDEVETPFADSALLREVVLPALLAAEQSFARALSGITVDEMLRSARET
jgi:Rrf2 family protein